jgi:hypothetical protein
LSQTLSSRYVSWTSGEPHIIIMSLVTDPFFPVCFLNQRWTPSLRFQVSHCSAIRSTCDVPSIAVFCKKSIECVPGIYCCYYYHYYLQLSRHPVAGVILHIALFMFGL